MGGGDQRDNGLGWSSGKWVYGVVEVLMVGGV